MLQLIVLAIDRKPSLIENSLYIQNTKKGTALFMQIKNLKPLSGRKENALKGRSKRKEVRIDQEQFQKIKKLRKLTRNFQTHFRVKGIMISALCDEHKTCKNVPTRRPHQKSYEKMYHAVSDSLFRNYRERRQRIWTRFRD